MNFNRRRNIFTLGDFHTQQHPQQQIKAQLNRRQNSDPFERDPFKIQSYNFRYADRPAYPLQNLANRVSNHSSVKRFETYYYNYDFAPARHDKENPPTNKFHEFRRRKYLYDQQQQSPPTNLLNQTINGRQSGLIRYQHRNQQFNAAPATTFATCDTGCNRITNGGSGNTSAGSERATAGMSTRTSSTMSAFKQTEPPLLRSVCNRDYLQGMRTVTPSGAQATKGTTASAATYAYRPQTQPQQQQQQYHQQKQQTQQQQPHQRHQLQHPHQQEHAPQQYVVSRLRGCSRSSLAGAVASENGGKCRNYESAVGGVTSGSSGSSSTAFAYKSVLREMPSPRTSTSEHGRRPLQTLQVPTQNLITANVEQACGSCSGCQININIKGLDNKQIGENVTIKIEADKNTNNGSNGSIISSSIALNKSNNDNGNTGNSSDNHSKNNNYTITSNNNKHKNNDSCHKPSSSNNLSSNITSPNKTDALNIVADNSSDTFVIDKRLSKFSVQDKHEKRGNNNERNNKDREPMRSAAMAATVAANERVERGRARQRARELFRSTPQQPLKCLLTPYDEASKKIPKTCKDRLPSMVPWHIDTTLRKRFPSKENTPQNSDYCPTSYNRRIRNIYNSGVTDMRNLKQYAEQKQSSKTPERSRAGCCRESDGKILNSLSFHRKFENVPRKQSSRSLSSTIESKSVTIRSFSSDRSSSIGLKQQGSAQPLFVHSRQNLAKSPFNVNINVYADKLKLLRV